jgi:hypothetical protein
MTEQEYEAKLKELEEAEEMCRELQIQAKHWLEMQPGVAEHVEALKATRVCVRVNHEPKHFLKWVREQEFERSTGEGADLRQLRVRDRCAAGDQQTDQRHQAGPPFLERSGRANIDNEETHP